MLDVEGGVRHHQRIGLRIGLQHAIGRHERLQNWHQIRRVDMPQGDQPCDDLIARRGEFAIEDHWGAALFGVLVGQNLDDAATGHGGESLDLQHGLENGVGFIGRDLGRGDDRDFATDLFIDNKILLGDLADELGEHGNIDILEVHGDQGVGGLGLTVFARAVVLSVVRRIERRLIQRFIRMRGL